MSLSTSRQPRASRPLVVTLAAVLLLSLSGAGAYALHATQGTQEIVIGAVAPQQGALAEEGAAAFRGVDLALAEFSTGFAGKSIRLLKAGTDGTPESALEQTKQLVELDDVDVVVGPLAGDEELRIKEYARSVPTTTFVSTSATQDLTLRNPVPNIFRFTPDNAQWQAGLGLYAYHDLGYRRIAVVAGDAAFAHAQVGGFMTEFCSAGGHVVYKLWVSTDVTDYVAVVAAIPADVEAVYLALDADQTDEFLTAYDAAGAPAPLIAGSETLDAAVLASTGTVRSRLIGVPSAAPIAPSSGDPAWQKFVGDHEQAFPGVGAPSLSTYLYYVATKATLLGLEQIDGDLRDGQERFREALSGLTFYTPTGPVRVDHNNQAIASSFVSVVDVTAEGALYQKIVRVVPNVNQTLGLPETKFLAQGQFGRDNPACP